jgi:cytoskeletal protein CcmA (bactofilin family)
MAGYTRQSSYTDGDVINAADSNNEFNQILAAFVNTSGHKHDGTAAEGPVIGLIGDPGVATPLNKVVVDDTNNRVGVFVDAGGAGSTVEQVRFQDGAIVPVTDNDIDLGTSSVEFKNAFFDGAVTTDTIVVNSTIGHDDDTDLMTLADGIVTVAGEISVTTLDIGGTNVTSTAAELNILDGVTSTAAELNILDGVTATTAELNIMDGGTSATSTTVADADRVVFNDGGTMKQVAVTDLAAYFDDEITAMPNLTSVGTLTTLTVDNVIINGTTIGHTDDTDLITLADGIATVAGEVSMTTLDIGGTNVTATAAELNIMDGVTATTAELNIMDGVTATTAELNIMDGVTATTAELNLMDGGTSASSTTLAAADRLIVNDNGTMKQVALSDFETFFESALDTTSNITTVGALNSGSITSGFGNIDTGSSTITTTGLITGGSLDIDDVVINGTTIGHTDDTDLMTVANGVLTVAGEVSMTTLDIGGTNVTSTAAELNILDGVTATAAELNILDGVTSTAAELNILDGVTSTAAELNILDGVTATTAELNYSDTGASVGTVVASKVVTVDANKDVASFRNITLTGELDAGSLDVSGDADIDGTLEADAITVNGTALNTVIANEATALAIALG